MITKANVATEVVTAEYKEFTSWKNGRNGITAGALGAVVWSDLTLADNRLVNFEVELDANCEECAGVGYLDGALIVGRTIDNIKTGAPVWSSYGIVTARSER